MNKWKIWICGCAVALPLAAQAQIDLKSLDRDMLGPRSQVLVLGTVHYRELPDSFKPTALSGLIDKLAAYKPDIITIENIPGEECDFAARHPAKFDSDYCAPTDAAKTATGLEIPAALAEITNVLKDWPAQPTPSQRRHLAALFFAANERASAYVQWLQLSEAERHVGEGLDKALVEILVQAEKRNNESYQLAAQLAARLGLPRLHHVDNHTGDNLDIADTKAFVRVLETGWGGMREEMKERQKREKDLKQGSDFLPLYRFINDPEYLRLLAETNISPLLRTKSPEGYPQMWVAGWETRNLRMVANIRETFRQRPGARVLTIVGASHKPWFDQWLGQMQGVDIVDAEKILK